MRRILSILRKPVPLLALAFVLWAGFFSCALDQLRTRPKYEFATTDDGQRYLDSVCDDGTKVLRFDFDSFHGDNGLLHVWDAPTGADLTPDIEKNPDRALADDRRGLAILQDGSLWPAFRNRLLDNRQKAVAE